MNRIHPSHRVEEIKLHVPSPFHITLSTESVYFSPHHTVNTKCRFFCDEYHKRIIALIVIVIVGLSIVIASTGSIESSDNPCINYSLDEYASRISMTCFRHLWSKVCKKPLPDGFNGEWWLRSPNGGRMVSCSTSYNDKECGAGSYQTVVTYLYLCNPYYDGR
jgi:hypothetical protein